MIIAEIEFPLTEKEFNIKSLDWLAHRLTGLLGSSDPFFYSEADKWVLGSSNNYFLHLHPPTEGSTVRVAFVTARYSLQDEVLAAVRTIIVSIWGLHLRDMNDH